MSLSLKDSGAPRHIKINWNYKMWIFILLEGRKWWWITPLQEKKSLSETKIYALGKIELLKTAFNNLLLPLSSLFSINSHPKNKITPYLSFFPWEDKRNYRYGCHIEQLDAFKYQGNKHGTGWSWTAYNSIATPSTGNGILLAHLQGTGKNS